MVCCVIQVHHLHCMKLLLLLIIGDKLTIFFLIIVVRDEICGRIYCRWFHHDAVVEIIILYQCIIVVVGVTAVAITTIIVVEVAIRSGVVAR